MRYQAHYCGHHGSLARWIRFLRLTSAHWWPITYQPTSTNSLRNYAAATATIHVYPSIESDMGGTPLLGSRGGNLKETFSGIEISTSDTVFLSSSWGGVISVALFLVHRLILTRDICAYAGYASDKTRTYIMQGALDLQDTTVDL